VCGELGIASRRDATEETADRLSPPLSLRMRHVVTEKARVDAAAAALSDGDLTQLG